MSAHSANNKVRLYVGMAKIKKGYIGDKRFYSAGSIVTYHVDTGISYQEEVDEGASCLAPKTFTPVKSGWTFIGWRTDKAASATVLTGKMMGDTPVTLYAVFKQTVTLSYAGNGNTGGSTAAQSGTRCYNNGNVANPSFVIRSNGFVKSGYTWQRWRLGSTSGTAYAAGSSITLAASSTLYAEWLANTLVIWTKDSNGTLTTAYPSYNSNYVGVSGLDDYWRAFGSQSNHGATNGTLTIKTLGAYKKAIIKWRFHSKNSYENDRYVEVWLKRNGNQFLYNTTRKSHPTAWIETYEETETSPITISVETKATSNSTTAISEGYAWPMSITLSL